MRRLGAGSLRRVCEVDLHVLGPQIISVLSERLSSVDSLDTHGALLALGEIASSFNDTDPSNATVRNGVKLFTYTLFA